MQNQFQLLIQNILSNKYSFLPEAIKQFNLDAESENEVLKSINISFLIMLAGSNHSQYKNAKDFIEKLHKQDRYKQIAEFYLNGNNLVLKEFEAHLEKEPDVVDRLKELNEMSFESHNEEQIRELFWSVFFPQGIDLMDADKRREKVNQLREIRKIDIINLNANPILNPSREIIFTSNVLLTKPLDESYFNDDDLSDDLKNHIKSVGSEKQKYWYDHPIPIGIAPEKNEVLHGLKGLSEMLSFEKSRGNANKNDKLNCLLSVSVTHDGLHNIAKEYLTNEIKKSKSIKDINIYIFTENETEQLIEEILSQIVNSFPELEKTELKKLNTVFGVDGEYGRHYSFLKAITAFWQVFVDEKVKGTFKIDLDQVFPNKEQVEQSEASVFEHFKSPLWGAKGRDAHGNNIDLSMIAGALVNESDIDKALYYPDVRFPTNSKINADEYVFFSRLPQSLSTEAEMMEKYKSENIDGENTVISRIHVTGGTNGILINALKKYRPFTPSFIGRAEDQAYIMSVLFESPCYLRYLHKSGLIMRHDKNSFAGEAIKAAETGKIIGDYLRILLFSFYAKMLPWSVNRIKSELDPFTGCFISDIPYTIVYLRFALLICSLFNNENDENQFKAIRLINEGIPRLLNQINIIESKNNRLQKQFIDESISWYLFYDILDIAEKQIKSKDNLMLDIKTKAEKIIQNSKII
jgi:hypothetical protein